jgi:hypothetical protein
MRLSLTALLGFGLMTGAHRAEAQNTGSVLGNVQDKTGAVVAGATVTVADPNTGISRDVKSNGSGEFLVPSLPVGTYILTVTAPTFETSVITDIKVDANSSIKEDVKLQSGSATESVTVQDTQGSVIDPNSATIGTLLDPKLIEDLPIDGHNVVALTALLPGVVDVNAPATFTGDTKGPTYSAGGSRNTQNLMLFDGLMWNNLFYNTGINFPTPNELQEVSVLLNNYKAEFGRNAGSVFSVIAKRGGNAIHGSAWDYVQNQAFNAADYLSKQNPKDNQNQFGFQIGAPILRDKLFISGAYQQLIGRLQTTASDLIPGYAERGVSADGKTPLPCTSTGPFAGMTCASYLADVTVNGVAGKFTNPITLAGASGNQATSQSTINDYTSDGLASCIPLLNAAAAYANINNYANTGKLQPTYMPFAEMPTQCLNPVMLNFANTPGILPTTSPVTSYAVTKSPSPTGDKRGTVKLNYNANEQNSFDVLYDLFKSTNTSPLGVNSQSQGIATYDLVNQAAVSNFANLGYTRVITPSLLNVLRFGYKRFESTQFPTDSRTWNSFGGNFVEPGLPTLPAINVSNTFALGSTSQGYQDHINENVELNESLSWTRGNHNVKGGFSFLRLQYLTRADYPGSFSFSTTFTGLAQGDFFTGLLNSINAQNRLLQGGIQHEVFSYIQDDWRATARLTLNLGIRYELPFQWFEPHGESATFVPGLQSIVYPNAPGGLAFPGDRGVRSSLAATDFNGIVPRVGFAYDLYGTGKFLIRGGFGMFSDAINANVVGVGEPYHYSFLKQIPAGGATIPLENTDAAGNPNGTVLTVPAGFDPKNPQFIAPFSNFFPDPNFRTPYVMAVNFGFQWHVPHGGVLEPNYVAKLARKLTIPVDLNPTIVDCTGGYFAANPSTYCKNANSTTASDLARVRYQDFNYGGQGLVDLKSAASASYHALQVQYTQRSGRYISLVSSYTYSRSIDLQTNGQTTSNAVPDVFNINSDLGPSDNNATHVFNLGWVTRYPKFTGGNFITRAILNDWVFSGIYNAHTGRPYSVTINNDSALDDEPNQRAQILQGVQVALPSNRHRLDKVNEYFNTSAFTYPVVGTFANQGRNSLVGPGYILTDMTVGRDFPMARIRDGMRANFRIEGYNVFNTPNLGNPNAQFSCSTTTTYTGSAGLPGIQGPNQILESCLAAGGNFPINAITGQPNFGRVLNTYGNNANTSTNGRKIQLALTIFY